MPAKRELPAVVAALGWLVTASVVIVPIVVAPDFLDRFRVVKESAARIEGFLGLLLIIAAVALGSADRLREMARERLVGGIFVAGVVWAAITTLASTHRPLSTESFIALFTSAMIFLSAWYAAPRVSLVAFDLLVPVLLVNAVLAAMQEYGIWNPFTVSEDIPYRHLTATALIGNPNIVGTYMTLVTILLAAATPRVSGWRRWWYAFGALVGGVGVVVSRTRTAVIALLVGLALLAIGRSWKRAVIFACIVLALVGIGLQLKVRVLRNIVALPSRAYAFGLDAATSGRVTPALAALNMFRDHPVTGVGPGVFRYQYMSYQVQLRSKHPDVTGVRPTNFAEAHNDHLQMLAESGAIGYLLFLGSFFVIWWRVRRSDADGEKAAVARAVVLPFAVTLLVLCLAQFPMHLAITRQLMMTVAGLAIGWRSAA